MAVDGPSNSGARIAVVARDEALAGSLELLLRASGFDVVVHGSGQALLDAPGPADWLYLFADGLLPDRPGLVLAAALRERGWTGVAVVMVEHDVSASPPPEGVVFLEKPFAPGEIAAIVSGARLRFPRR